MNVINTRSNWASFEANLLSRLPSQECFNFWNREWSWFIKNTNAALGGAKLSATVRENPEGKTHPWAGHHQMVNSGNGNLDFADYSPTGNKAKCEPPTYYKRQWRDLKLISRDEFKNYACYRHTP